jgi:hypothetical protein
MARQSRIQRIDDSRTSSTRTTLETRDPPRSPPLQCDDIKQTCANSNDNSCQSKCNNITASKKGIAYNKNVRAE